MEVHIIFTHELEQTDVLRVEPPLLPFGGIVSRDAHVPNGGIKLKDTVRVPLVNETSNKSTDPNICVNTFISLIPTKVDKLSTDIEPSPSSLDRLHLPLLGLARPKSSLL